MRAEQLAVKRWTLEQSGLTVLCVQQPALHVVEAMVHVRGGPRFESPAECGLSHAVEHMLFRGTSSLPDAYALSLAAADLGASLGAATMPDRVWVRASLPPENLEPGLALLADLVAAPIFADLEIERGVLKEELWETLDDEGRLIDPDDLMSRLLFGAHGLGQPIGGTLETLEALGVEALSQIHRRHYCGRNMVLTVAGPVDPKAVRLSAAGLFERLAAGRRLFNRPPAPLAPGPHLQHVGRPGSQASLRLAFAAPGRRHRSHATAEVLCRVIDDDSSTRLFRRLCGETGLCYEVGAEYDPFQDCGLLGIDAQAHPSRLAQVVREILALLGELRHSGPSLPELTRCQARHRWRSQAMLDDAFALADHYGTEELYGTAVSLAGWNKRVDAVKLDEVAALARDLFRPECLCAVVVGDMSKDVRKQIRRAIDDFTERKQDA